MFVHEKIRLSAFVDPLYQENGYVIRCDGSKECWVIDPGFSPACDEIVGYLRSERLSPQAIVLTHAHVDHIAGVRPILQSWGPIPVWSPSNEAELLTSAVANLSAFIGMPVTAPPADRLLQAGEALSLADSKWQLIDVAGHSPGGLAYYCESGKVLISGDAVFSNSIGRYDFPHSSRKRLITNIYRNILPLPDAVTVYSGHGPPATIGDIRRNNDVLRYELAQMGLAG